ncbi:MAG: hypothetical protein ABJA82_10515 [Myxococcales bacterium]
MTAGACHPASRGRAATWALGALALTVPTAATAAPEGATAAASASSTSEDAEDEPGKQPISWHGSTLLFDQSVTTQTVGVGADYQSANPTYEWWVALKPRYFVYETRATAVSVNLWANLFLELTNSDTTTRRRETVIGPTYLWASYARTLGARRGYKTTFTVGPRLTIPTDKVARNSGQIVGAGGTIGLTQAFPLRGTSARALRGARLSVGAIYNHPFVRATTGVNDDLRWTRQDVGGRPIFSDQLTGAALVQHALNASFSAELDVLPRLNVSASYVLLNAWLYPPNGSDCVAIRTGCDLPIEVANPTTFRVSTWATAAVTYEVVDDLSVSLGYYNLASQIGDGTHRNPLWSPAARFFLSVTGNLDVAYARLMTKR